MRIHDDDKLFHKLMIRWVEVKDVEKMQNKEQNVVRVFEHFPPLLSWVLDLWRWGEWACGADSVSRQDHVLDSSIFSMFFW